jgi:hypothetical protein
LPLKIRPTRVKGTYYLLIPKDIADLYEIDQNTSFTLRTDGDSSEVLLSYKRTRWSEEKPINRAGT